MRLLDVCCSDGGAGEGYRRAGFDVTGVDIVRRSGGYPCGTFIKADALDVLSDREWVRANFDAVHASFPCQTHSITRNLRDAQGKGTQVVDLLPEGMPLLRDLGLPYVSENVPQATAGDLRADLLLCGSMFPELHVHDSTGRRWLQRHRVFESNVMLMPPGPCRHKEAGVRPLGVYGSKSDDIPSGGQTCSTVEQARALMGIPWMGWKALTEAIPPAYTHWIGGFLLSALEALHECRGGDVALDCPGHVPTAPIVVDSDEPIGEAGEEWEGEDEGHASQVCGDDVVGCCGDHAATVRPAPSRSRGAAVPWSKLGAFSSERGPIGAVGVAG